MSESKKSASWDHIDLRGRKMLHPPWTPSATSTVSTAASSTVSAPTARSALKAPTAPGEAEASRRTQTLRTRPLRKQPLLRQPPRTLQEILTAFLAAGGSSDQLCELLNDHMPSAEYVFDPAELRDPNRVYSLEFYFYFFTFCKILLGDPEFRYGRGDEQLDIHHYILEKGKLDHPPWKVDGTRNDGYLSIANIRAIFVFVEQAFQFDGGVSGEHTGGDLAREVLSFMNRYVDEAYRVDRAFFNKEEILVSFEYLFTITSIFELLMNTPDLISAAYRFGTLHNHHLAQAVFLLAGKSPSEKMEEWVRRTNDVYDFDFFAKKQSLEVRVDATRIADSGVFGVYEANCFRGIKQAFPAIFSAFMEIAKEKKNRVRLNWSKKDPYTFKVRVSWGPPLLFYLKTAGLAALVMALGLFLQEHWNGYIPPLLTILLAAAFLGAIGFLFAEYTSQKKRNEKTKALIFTQLNSLQTLTRELMKEKENRKFEGTGLGLALVKKISDLHNWKIEAEGIPGQGACFTLTLPLSEETADSPAPKNEIRKKIKQLGGDLFPRDKAAGPASGSASGSSAGSASESGSASAKHDEKILIIDDNPDMASILKDILEKEYPVEWSPGGEQALRQLLSGPGYSLVICDMMMPGMSGLELRKEFLKSRQDEDIPFIFLTALADPHIRQQALETGGVDYITKPFSSEELKLKIRNLIETGRHQYKKAVRDIQGAERLMKFHELDSHIKNEHVLVEYRITKAEKRILNLLKQGLQDKEIADAAGISPRTVSTHLRNLYKKTGTQNRLELINKVFQ